MFEGLIFFKEEHKREIEDIFNICIPNDYEVFVNDYRLHYPDPWSDYYMMSVVLDDSKEWAKLKKIYFKGRYKKRALPGAIHIV